MFYRHPWTYPESPPSLLSSLRFPLEVRVHNRMRISVDLCLGGQNWDYALLFLSLAPDFQSIFKIYPFYF